MEITIYIIASILAIIFGQAVKHLCKKLPPVVSEEISYKEFFSTFKNDFKVDIKYTLILLILFNALFYYLGNNVTTYLYAVVSATLLVVFSVDYRFQLIPDEAHIVIGLVGIINLVLHLNLWYTYLFGALIGGGIFLGLGYLALLVFHKEGMGFGDVKLMAALGFLFGMKNILVIALVSFIIGAVIGVILISIKKKKTDSYIPFGPFIVMATILLMFVPADDIIFIYISFCTWLGRGITDIIYNFMNK